jgi:hypothetical protein
MHPFASNLKNLNTADLHENYKNLHQKTFMTNNGHVLSQMYMLLEDYKEEIDKRNQAIKNEIPDLDLDNLIKVK